MKTFVISDTHFGHRNIIRHCNRPFSDVEEMDKTMIDNWNSIVSPNDEVFHLGDFSFKDQKTQYFPKLNGRIHLIYGNHDKRSIGNNFYSSWDYKELKIDGQLYVLCHYPIESWNKKRYGSIHLHGHTHGLSKTMSNRFDVGVDVQEFRPVLIQEYLAIKKTEGLND